jgi:ATP-dependent helicase/nuclease subunit B
MQYLRLLLIAISENFATLPFLSLLKHPYCRLGMAEAEYAEALALFERYILRGYKIEDHFDGYARILARLKATPEGGHTADDLMKLEAFIARLKEQYAPSLALIKNGAEKVDVLFKHHLTLAETLAETPSASGKERLWFGDEAVQKAAEFMHSFSLLFHHLPAMTVYDYRLFFEKTLSEQTIRLPYGLHPRLSILGAIEGRLYSPDVVILGGLNEGKWPKDPAADPYLSRPMRRALGLPQAEYDIGLAAHDFFAYAAADHVIMTYARKQDGAPLQPSRWLLRLEALLDKTALPLSLEGAYIQKWHQEMQREGQNSQSYPRPCPKPPLKNRPKQLSVTQIDSLFNNPYAIYVEKILRLKELDELDQSAEQKLRGNTIHLALQYFLEESGDLSYARLLACGQRAFAEMNIAKQDYDYWWPRFVSMAELFAAHEQKRRAAGYKPILFERRTHLDLLIEDEPFRLIAKVDRIDQGPDGDAEIIDYKSGKAKTIKNLKNGKAPQLSLTAYLVQKNAFPELTAKGVGALHYYLVGGAGDKAFQMRGLVKAEEVEMAMKASYLRLYDTIRYYQNGDHGYEASTQYEDYQDKLKHFARVSEWAVDDDEAIDEAQDE